MGKDYYNILGIDRNASKDDIKKAYRKLAMQYHPDKNPGDKIKEEKFKDISEAYSILSNDDKKSKYDRFGNVDGHEFNMNDFMGGFDFNDIFNFGGTSGWDNPFYRKTKKGNDLRVKLNISLLDVRNGIEKNIKYKRKIKCTSCDGFGGETNICSTCNGTGSIKKVKRTIIGNITTQGECHICNGEGNVVVNQCNTCFGTGVVDHLSELKINLPKGIENGDRFKLNGKGNSPFRPGKGGLFGDLIIEVFVEEHPVLIRSGINLIYKLNLPLPMLILGGKSKVPTLENLVEIKIKPFSKIGEVLRLKGKGLSDQRGYIGDILVEINVYTPNNINDEEKELLEKLSDMPNFKND